MDTKEKILYTALDLFSRNGYEAASVNDIAVEIGITKGALYKHYTNKRDILDSILALMDEKIDSVYENFSIPPDFFTNMPASFKGSYLEQICALVIFRYLFWTEDSFASRFRQILTIEQFRSDDMRELFEKYFGTGPIEKLEKLFMHLLDGTVSNESPRQLALELYSPVYMLVCLYEPSASNYCGRLLKEHIEGFVSRLCSELFPSISPITYPRSTKYMTEEYFAKLTGPNQLKLTEELFSDCAARRGSTVLNMSEDSAATSVFLAREYGFEIYSENVLLPNLENARLLGRSFPNGGRISSYLANNGWLPFNFNFFDAIVSVNSFHLFGMNKGYTERRILPYLKSGGYLYLAVPGTTVDFNGDYPEELIASWSPDQLSFMRDMDSWRSVVENIKGVRIVKLREMESSRSAWYDWINHGVNFGSDVREAIERGAGKYLTFFEIVLTKI